MRYIVLVLLCLPVILLALVNILTQYKMHRISETRFRHQIIGWLLILVILIGSFPFYNFVTGKPILDSSELSLFDIVQTVAIIFLFYVINHQRQSIERNEAAIYELHRKLSIQLSVGGSTSHGKNKDR